MKKQSLFVAVAAIMMAACSETDNLSVQNVAQQQSETAVGFDTYMGRSTRAGAVGEITTKEDLQISNFGVFAYYTQGNTGANHYPTATGNTSSFKPDFMWNQKVEFDGDNWFYFPVKYWPNEAAGNTSGAYVDAADPTNNHATTPVTTAPDKVTFFAYAPYVEASTNGTVTPNADGITGILTLNDTKRDPRLSYTTPSDPLKTVDLLWGVVPAYKTKYTTVLGEQDLAASGLPGAGRPNYNLIKQKQDERIMFQFKHALAKLTLDVVGFFDDVPVGGANTNPDAVSENNVAKDTKIVVEYVKLSTNKYPNASVLNLNNYTAADKPEWEQANNSGNIDFTINGSMLTNLIRYRTPSAPDKGYAEQPRGVTKDAIALLANDASQEAFYGIIPCRNSGAADNTPWKVEVKYHVFTKDANLENGYSEITNVIKKEDIQMTFDPGKHYTLRLRLGMTTVKFDATVEDWIEGGTTPADLPINVAVASVDNAKFTATNTALSNYSAGYDSEQTAEVKTTPTDLNLENISYKLSVSNVGVTLENGTKINAGKAATTINTDVDWIKQVYNYTTNEWELIISENLTSAERIGKIWATYGGVDSKPITVTQNGSRYLLTVNYASGNPASRSIAWDAQTQFGYKVTAYYQDNVNRDRYIDYSVKANNEGTFNYANWVKITKTADAATGIIEPISKNEDEVNAREALVTISYDGETSVEANSIKLIQGAKPAVVTP